LPSPSLFLFLLVTNVAIIRPTNITAQVPPKAYPKLGGTSQLLNVIMQRMSSEVEERCNLADRFLKK
jgi:hypothetical protein